MRAQASETPPEAVAPLRFRADAATMLRTLEAAAQRPEVPIDLGDATLTDCFDLLARTDAPCAYFSARDGEREQLALGCAALRRFGATSSTSEVLASLDGSGPWFGGFRFDPEQEASEAWAAFGAAYFFRPLLHIESRRGRVTLRLDHDAEHAVARAHELGAAMLGSTSALAASAPANTEAEHSSAAWRVAFEDAIAALDRNALDKVVLAQTSTLEGLAHARIGRALARCRTQSPDCFRFALRTGPDLVFATNSPELLLRAEGQRVETEALAGTRPAERASELLQDDKELREQRFVSEAIAKRLRECSARAIEVDGPHPRTHGPLAHLATRFRAELDGDPRKLIAALHPTPAVCGSPRPEALRFLRAREAIDRGLYAGGVGVVGEASIELAVALRSVLLHGSTATIFAGGGIVRGSSAEAEAREIEQKSALWRALLTDDS